MGWVTEHHPTSAGLASCVQCGLCLPVCPTFRLTGRETASPRGRLQAMSAVNNGIAGVDAKFEEVIDFCLGCRACEPVCPGMVPYGSLLEGARAEITVQRRSPGKRFRAVVLGRLIGSARLLSWLSAGLRLATRVGLTKLAPGRFRRSLSGMRPLSSPSRSLPALSPGEGATVGLLTGCVQEQWFPDVNRAAHALLTKAGYDVVVPEGQTCCGALAAHDGHADAAERLARVNDSAFGDCDLVVATAAGCSAHLADLSKGARDITVMISTAIAEGRLPVVDQDNGPIVIQDPCHLRHAQRVIEEPRRILRAAGYEVVELGDNGLCCGAAGLYTILEPDASAELGARKASLVEATGQHLVASANPGCEMQLRSFLGSTYRIAHPIELYLEAIEGAATSTNVTRVEAGS